MKKYSALFLVGVILPVLAWAVFEGDAASEAVAVKSVEFEIAEPSLEGVGLAMPASGSSGAAPDSPGCSLDVLEGQVLNGDSITIEWQHFAAAPEYYSEDTTDYQFSLDSLNGLGVSTSSVSYTDTPVLVAKPNRIKIGNLYSYNNEGWVPNVYDYTSQLEGRSCVGYCDATDPSCRVDNFAEAIGVIDVVNGGNGSTFAEAVIQKSNLLASISPLDKIMPLVRASGDGDYVCRGAWAEEGSTVVKTGSDGLSSGVFLVGMVTQYEDRYGSHHYKYAYSACNDYITISAPPVPEMIADISGVATNVPIGQDLNLTGELRNIGAAATNFKFNGPAPMDGRINYEFTLDLNNDGSVDYRVNNDDSLSSASANPMGPDTRRAVSALIPASVLSDVGTHVIKLCVNHPESKRRFEEIGYSNNCMSAELVTSVPDLAAYVYPATAIQGDTAMVINGFALNIGTVAVTQDFDSEFQIREKNNPSNFFVVKGVRQTGTIEAGGGVEIKSLPFNPVTKLGNNRNLEYRLWVDSPDNEVREQQGNDNVRGSDVGNNDSDWLDLTLIPPDVSVESRMPASPPYKYDTGVKISFPFRIHNETAFGMTTSFMNSAVIDANGDCGNITNYTNGCVDYELTPQETTSLLASGYDSVAFNWETNLEGTYRIKVFADSGDVLDEGNESNNISPWVTFVVDENITCNPGDPDCTPCNPSDPLCVEPCTPGDPGCDPVGCNPAVDTNCPPADQDVYITATPTVIRKGSPVTITWDIGERTPSTCDILINDVTMLDESLSSQTGIVTDSPTQRTQYKLDCAAQGSYVRSQDTVHVNVLPSLYES